MLLTSFDRPISVINFNGNNIVGDRLYAHNYFVFTLTEYGIIPFIFMFIDNSSRQARVSLRMAKLNRNNVCLIIFNYVFFVLYCHRAFEGFTP